MINVVVLQGRLTKDPKVYEKFVSFSIAINPRKDQVLFLDCVAFGSNIDYISKYARKGKRVLIQGSLGLKNGDEKSATPDNESRIQIKILVRDISIIDTKDTDVLVDTDTQEPNKTIKTGEQIYQESVADDDLPF